MRRVQEQEVQRVENNRDVRVALNLHHGIVWNDIVKMNSTPTARVAAGHDWRVLLFYDAEG